MSAFLLYIRLDIHRQALLQLFTSISSNVCLLLLLLLLVVVVVEALYQVYVPLLCGTLNSAIPYHTFYLYFFFASFSAVE